MTGIVMLQHSIFWQLPHAFTPNCLLQIVMQHLTVLCSLFKTPFLIMFKDWYLQIPKQCQHNFPHCWLRFKLHFDKRYWVFPFHALTLSLRIVVEDPHFIAVKMWLHRSGWFYRQNHDWSAIGLSLHKHLPSCCQELTCRLVQCALP
jgi:hypothetical protein